MSFTICRACLKNIEVEKTLNIFDSTNSNSIFEQINSLVNIDIRVDDGLPSSICVDCLLDLQNAIHFKQRCEHSNILLRSGTVELNNIVVKDDIKKEKDDLEAAIPEDNEDNIYFNTEYIDDYFEDEIHIKVEDDTEVKEPVQEINNTKLCNSYRKSRTINKTVAKVLSQEVKGASTKTTCNANKPSKAIDLKLECHDCGGFFRTKCKLRVHWKKEHMQSQLICDICKRIFKSYKAYHIHKKNKNTSCSTAAKLHIEGVGKSRIFHCNECNYSTKDIRSIRTHSVVHTGERPFVCDQCPEAYSQISSLIGHKEMVHQKNQKQTTCHLCGKLVIGRNSIYKHLSRHKNRSVPCDICHKIFKTPNCLKEHMKRHSGIKEFACELCGKAFFTFPELCSHKKTHAISKMYKCDICGYTNIRNAVISKHKKKHTDNNVPCLICGRFVENSEILALHQKKHFDKKHLCPHCDGKFYARKSLMNHIRKQHKLKILYTKVEESLETSSSNIN